MTALMLPPAPGTRQSVIHAGLAVLPAFTVLAVPKFARDFAWFGPQEPLLLGGLALGGSLLALAAGSAAVRGAAGEVGDRGSRQRRSGPLLASRRVPEGGRTQRRSRSPRRRCTSGVATSAAGSALSSARRYALAAIAAVAVLPLVHVAVETVRITLRGDIVYGAEVDGGAGIVDGLQILYDWLHEAIPRTAQRPHGRSHSRSSSSRLLYDARSTSSRSARSHPRRSQPFSPRRPGRGQPLLHPALRAPRRRRQPVARAPSGLVAAAGVARRVLRVHAAHRDPCGGAGVERTRSSSTRDRAASSLNSSVPAAVARQTGSTWRRASHCPVLTGLAGDVRVRACSAAAYLVLPELSRRALALRATCGPGDSSR